MGSLSSRNFVYVSVCCVWSFLAHGTEQSCKRVYHVPVRNATFFFFFCNTFKQVVAWHVPVRYVMLLPPRKHGRLWSWTVRRRTLLYWCFYLLLAAGRKRQACARADGGGRGKRAGGCLGEWDVARLNITFPLSLPLWQAIEMVEALHIITLTLALHSRER